MNEKPSAKYKAQVNAAMKYTFRSILSFLDKQKGFEDRKEEMPNGGVYIATPTIQ